MTHCGCDPEFGVSPSPLFFLPFLWEWLSCLPLLTVRSLAFEGVSLSEVYCLGPVTAWAAESSDTAWIHSFIIRQMGLVQVRTVWQGPAASPLPPHPDVSQHRGGWTVRVQLGEEGPPSSTPPCPFRPPFPLLCCSEPSPVRKRGDSFVPKHTHKI